MIESLDFEGQGIAHSSGGKVVFVEGALPGEQVTVDIERSKNNWARGKMVSLKQPSAQRVEPACPHFNVCGGCKLQHLHSGAQLATKQRALENALWHLGKVKPLSVLQPVAGPDWGYRHRARLSVFYLEREQRMLIGFHEHRSSYVADISVCPVMPERVAGLLQPLRELLLEFEPGLRVRIPQIEIALGAGVLALVLRHLVPVGASDLERLRRFALDFDVQWWLQAGAAGTARPLDDAEPVEGGSIGSRHRQLEYRLPEFDVRMPFRPTDFTQVNPAMNSILVRRALGLLRANSGERVIDWFCGLGNFTLPLATTASFVLGVEGSEALVERARSNARRNGLHSNTEFAVADLFDMTPESLAHYGTAQKWLVDPPRDGCFALVKALVALAEEPQLSHSFALPERIVYVSCDPSTLARDAGLLVHKAGYVCSAAGVFNMFPHTAHVESVAVFDRR